MTERLEQARQKLTFALDISDWDEAYEMARLVAPHVGRIKLGPVLLDNIGVPQVIKAMHQAGIDNLFIDLKYHNTANVVEKVVYNLTLKNVGMINVHCAGGIPMMQAAKKGARTALVDSMGKVQAPLVIGVTILTTLDYDDLMEVGITPKLELAEHKKLLMEDLVVSLARAAEKAGLDGVVASTQEAPLIRQKCLAGFRIVTPGIRPAGAEAGDQKRLDTPANAIKAGADELVVGKPIYGDPDPAKAAQNIVAEIADALAPLPCPSSGLTV